MSQAGHLILSVSNGKRSVGFYKKLLVRELAWKSGYDDGEAMAVSDRNGFMLWIVPAERKGKHAFKSVGYHHLAIRVSKKGDVNRIAQWCRRNKVKVVDAPAAYPQYSKKYYAVFFLDPDGMKLEVAYY